MYVLTYAHVCAFWGSFCKMCVKMGTFWVPACLKTPKKKFPAPSAPKQKFPPVLPTHPLPPAPLGGGGSVLGGSQCPPTHLDPPGGGGRHCLKNKPASNACGF